MIVANINGVYVYISPHADTTSNQYVTNKMLVATNYSNEAARYTIRPKAVYTYVRSIPNTTWKMK